MEKRPSFWTPARDAELLRHRSAGRSNNEIATLMGVSSGPAVGMRLVRLGAARKRGESGEEGPGSAAYIPPERVAEFVRRYNRGEPTALLISDFGLSDKRYYACVAALRAEGKGLAGASARMSAHAAFANFAAGIGGGVEQKAGEKEMGEARAGRWTAPRHRGLYRVRLADGKLSGWVSVVPTVEDGARLRLDPPQPGAATSPAALCLER